MTNGDQGERAARVMLLLGLSDDELCAVLDVDPLTLVSGQLEHRPELTILLDLIEEATASVGDSVMPRWVRTGSAGRRPIDALLARDFASFEAALEELIDRGFVLRGGRDG